MFLNKFLEEIMLLHVVVLLCTYYGIQYSTVQYTLEHTNTPRHQCSYTLHIYHTSLF